jgi:hypothetical protein
MGVSSVFVAGDLSEVFDKHTDVIARLDRATQYSRDGSNSSRGRSPGNPAFSLAWASSLAAAAILVHHA